MLDRRTIRALSARAALLVSLAGAASCGGPSAGDYTIYRIALEEQQDEPGCFPKDESPLAEAYDSTTFRTGQTLILYLATDDDAMLDTGGLVLRGTTDDDPYRFSGQAEDVEFPFSDDVVDSDRDGIADRLDPFVDADRDGKDDSEMAKDSSVDTDGDNVDDREDDDFVDADSDGDDDRYGEIVSDMRTIATLKVNVEMTVDGSTVSGVMEQTSEQRCEGKLCPPRLDAPCLSVQRFRGIEIEDADLVLDSSSPAPTP
ncbi:uncharacterized protein SOCE26_039920 [Sorangium cellulosum]|uniref:Secreted protein n=1 Tax=Sorangium cellulosum TaxID=56 RepID=A0A2L0ETF3_SORCE|nr:hypothetical protein [Sorangium cellulosum]AUX42559.1 uncharacterized protein SOCE26_039920 [Sorangium cellulosum]